MSHCASRPTATPSASARWPVCYGLIHVFGAVPGGWAGAAFRIGGAILWYLPYCKAHSLYFATWIQRVRMLFVVDGVLALMIQFPAFAGPPELWQPGAIMILGITITGGALLSLALEHRWIRPKI